MPKHERPIVPHRPGSGEDDYSSWRQLGTEPYESESYDIMNMKDYYDWLECKINDRFKVLQGQRDDLGRYTNVPALAILKYLRECQIAKPSVMAVNFSRPRKNVIDAYKRERLEEVVSGVDLQTTEPVGGKVFNSFIQAVSNANVTSEQDQDKRNKRLERIESGFATRLENRKGECFLIISSNGTSRVRASVVYFDYRFPIGMYTSSDIDLTKNLPLEIFGNIKTVVKKANGPLAAKITSRMLLNFPNTRNVQIRGLNDVE